ncbi:TPA: hypothetical protein ACQ8SF_005148 [Klebsiella pneumoniae]
MRQEKYDPFISNYRIAKSVSTVLKDRSWSYRRCAYQFNQHHKGQKISVTKDLVSRVANQEFRIVNERIRLLCEFLEISIYEGDRKEELQCVPVEALTGLSNDIKNEITRVTELVKENPALGETIAVLLRGITKIASGK